MNKTTRTAAGSQNQDTQANSNQQIAMQLFQEEWDQLTSREKKTIERILGRRGVVPNTNQYLTLDRTFGEKAADAIAAFGGSWLFIFIFMGFMIFWSILNTDVLAPRHDAFDPYPYVFLNLILSMLAAIQAPVIMMSQNRQGDRDRITAQIDHEINVREEIELRQLKQGIHQMEKRLEKVLTAVENNKLSASR